MMDIFFKNTALIIAVIGYLFWDYRREDKKVVIVDRIWRNSTFLGANAFNRDRLMEAYILLAGRMISKDTKDAGKKVIYMHKYFSQYFPNVEYRFQEVLSESYSDPVNVESVTAWLNRHLKSRSKKMQVMYFLAGLSAVDGSINGREMKLLHEINVLLDLTPKEFQTVIGIYQQRQKRQERKTTRNSSTSAKKSTLKLAYQVLGISEHASMDEIKKAYRKLVKTHHPDRFYNETKVQKEIATERFLEIQKAYEIIEKLK